MCVYVCVYSEVVVSVDDYGRKIKEKEAALDKWKTMEKEQLDAINEEAKHMEKLANKRSLLLKKVCCCVCVCVCVHHVLFTYILVERGEHA